MSEPGRSTPPDTRPPSGGAAEPGSSPTEEAVRQLFRQGRYGEAVPVIQAHLGEQPGDVPAYELLADALRFSGDKPGAAGALATAAQLYGEAGLVIQSIAAQKRVIKLGVEPDYSVARPAARAAAVAGADRVATPLFDELSDVEFREVAAGLEAVSFEPGQVVVAEGEPGDAMYVVVRGALEVLSGGAGEPLVLAELGQGDFFGEVALLTGRPRTATIRARTDVECLLLARPAFDTLVERFPRVKAILVEFHRRRAESTVEALVRRRGR